MPYLAPIRKRLHVCSYYCRPQEDIHCMPVVTSDDIMLEDLRKYNAMLGRDILGIREAPEADVAAFQAMVFACNPANTKCWLVTLYATLVEDDEV